jgi:hypothetical protein
MGAAEAVEIAESITACRDATDDKFLELAVNGKGRRDRVRRCRFAGLNPFRGIPIVPPATFLL